MPDKNQDEKRRLRDEVAELAEAVRGLQVQLALQQAGNNCCGCHHVYYPVASPPWVQPGLTWPVMPYVTSTITNQYSIT